MEMRGKGNQSCEDTEGGINRKALWVLACPLLSKSADVNSVVEDILQIWTLALSFSSGALLVIGWIFTQKKVKNVFLFFFPTATGLKRWLFLDYSFVLASAQKKKVPFL